MIDVVTNIELDAVHDENPIARAVRDACPGLEGTFEIIVDYKSSHRPLVDDQRHWLPGEWQVKTYAWLRQRQPEAPRVAAGVLLYLNELSPSANDVERIRREVTAGTTDVFPRRGSNDDRELQLTRSGTRVALSEEFLLRRAIRVVPIDNATLDNSTRQFDDIVVQIESQIAREEETGSISSTWPPTCQEYRTCVACDFKTFCPSPAMLRLGDESADSEPDEI
ncbi:MAG: PD-(D/E)XK nuclease family protein [Vulcanimicrobiaceae bacterium]